jgi:superfamily I DNA and/or RNA helicase
MLPAGARISTVDKFQGREAPGVFDLHGDLECR